MGKKTLRVVISAAVIIGATSMLFFTMMKSDAQLYKHVDEVMGKPDQYYGKHLQLHGFVDGEPERKADSLDYRFNIKNGNAVVLASYRGIVPDTFKNGSEVVLTGRLAPDGFHTEQIMAKCPSKYQPTDGPGGAAGK